MKRNHSLPHSSRAEMLQTFAQLIDAFAPQLLDNPELLDRLPAIFHLIVHSEPLT